MGEMLDLNPNDNQGVRDILLGVYLAPGRTEGTRSLFERYPGEGGGVRAWAEALERFLAEGAEAAAPALAKARRENRYAEDYLTGRKPMPRRMRPSMGTSPP